MKIHDLNENIEIDEFLGLPALTKKGRMIQQGNKAVQNVLSDELRQMEVELAVWMKQSGIKQLTADVKNTVSQIAEPFIGTEKQKELIAELSER
jgi:hypothetical protein